MTKKKKNVRIPRAASSTGGASLEVRAKINKQLEKTHRNKFRKWGVIDFHRCKYLKLLGQLFYIEILVVNVHSVKPNKKEVQISEFSEWRTSVEKQHTIECYYPDEKNLLKTLKKSKVKIDQMCDICSIKIDPYSKTLNETKNIRKDQDNNETFINPISFK